MPGDMWFPLSTSGLVYERQIAEAKAVCSSCPVRSSCLAEALAHRDGWGVFGGLTAEERARLLRKQRTPKVPA
jgi:WhiB family redox-sensing transcriptional regulator